MQCSPLDRVQFGPLTFTLSGEPMSAADDSHATAFPSWATGRVVKLVQRFAIDVDDERIADGVPFFYGSADQLEPCDARDVGESVMADLRSVAAYAGDDMKRWSEWADDMGAFSGDWSAAQIRESMDGFRMIDTWQQLILERIGAERYSLLVADPGDQIFH